MIYEVLGRRYFMIFDVLNLFFLLIQSYRELDHHPKFYGKIVSVVPN